MSPRPLRLSAPRAGRALLAALALVLAAPAGAAGGAEPLLAAVGDVTATAAVVWVRAEGGGPVTVEARPAGAGPVAQARRRIERRSDFTDRVVLDGLAPGTRYRWQVAGAGAVEAGEFVTAPRRDRAAPVRFLWSGDLGGGGFCRDVQHGYRIFRAMVRRRPDFFLFVGDTMYADVPCNRPGTVRGAGFVAEDLAGYRRHHRYQREDPALRAFLRATSLYAIWDDHEVRNDFAGPSEPRMPLGRRAFLDYFPIVPPAAEPTRLYRKFRWGRLLELFILDTRQYRSPNAMVDGPGKTMLGAAQRRWLLDQVSTSTAVWKAVVSSVSLSIPTGPPGRRDSWTGADGVGRPLAGDGFATERDAILRELRERGVRNLLFVVADVHHAELIRHQPVPAWSFHELVAGPLSATHGRPRPLDRGLNPRSLFARGGLDNFGEVSIEPDRLTVRFYDADGQALSAHALAPE